MAKKTTRVIKTKKKKWFTIVAPSVLNEVVIGETTAVEAENLVGRTVKSNLSTLTRNIKKQNITITSKVSEVKDNKALTYVTSYMTSPASVKRQVRRRRDKLEDSIVCKTSDNKLVRVKPMVLTKSNAKNSTLTSLRHAIRYYVISSLNKLSYGKFIELVLNDRFPREMRNVISAVYPIKQVNIRAFKLEEGNKAKATLLTKQDKEVYQAVVHKNSTKKSNPKSVKKAPEKEARSETVESKEEPKKAE